jgi:hypothetical protein
MLALSALLAIAAFEPTELTLDIPVYVAADIDPEILESALREAAAIFTPSGIHLNFALVLPGAAAANPTVNVVLQPRPARFVVHGCSRNRHDHRLGHTSFEAKRITLWSEQIARAVDGDWDRRVLPNVSDEVFARALGRVLAHELGHLFLRLHAHRDDGLMRASFSRGSLTATTPRAFRLSAEDLDTMRASLERLGRSGERNVAVPAGSPPD